MITEYTTFTPGVVEGWIRKVDLPNEPGYEAIKNIVEPLLDGCNMEHVSVLWGGDRRDMFVDEMGALKRLPINNPATNIYRAYIYRAYWLSQHPKAKPDDLAAIHGVAVIFHRIVWI